MEVSLRVGPPTTEAEAIPKAVACLWNPFPQLGCFAWPLRERVCLTMQKSVGPCWGIPRGAPLSQRRGGSGLGAVIGMKSEQITQWKKYLQANAMN